MNRTGCWLAFCLAVFLPTAAAGGESATLDVNALISKAVASGESRVVLPPGRHRADTVRLRDLRDFTLDGNGATLVFAGSRRAIDLRGGGGLVLRDLTIDYDPLPFTQGVVVAVDTKARTVTVKLHDGYPAFQGKKDFALHVYDPATRLLKAPGGDLFGGTVKQGETDRIWTFGSSRRPETFIAPGDLVALDWRREASHAVLATKVDGLTVENLTVLAAPAAALMARFCRGDHRITGMTIRRGDVPPPGATEPRLLSSVADGVNYGACAKGPLIENCDFSFLGDDSVNVHGACVVMLEAEAPDTYIVYGNHDMTPLPWVVDPGAPVRVLTDGDFAVTSTETVEALAVLKDRKIPFETLRRYFPRATNPAQVHTVFRLKFRKPVKLEVGQTLDFPSAAGNGFVIRGNHFHDHRARGLRLKASDGLIEDNRFERLLRCAILLGATYYPWREAGWAENVVIRNNRIVDVCTERRVMEPDGQGPGAITVQSDPYGGKRSRYPGNRNLLIEDNVIDGCQSAGIYLSATAGAVVRRNTIRNVNTGGDPSLVGRAHDYGVDGPITVAPECRDVAVEP